MLVCRASDNIVSVLCILSASMLLLIGCNQTPPDTAAAPRPNIIFILVDTLRADRLGCYENPGRLSPMMDQLADEGLLFKRTIATSSWTLPSIASIFCGYYPTVHKVTSYQQALKAARNIGGTVRYFGNEFNTLTEILQANGYATAGFSANPFITAKFGFAQGFDHFDGSFADNTTQGNVVNAAAIKWLEQRDNSKPFFLYLHYMDVHDPYKAGEQYVQPLVDAVARQPQKTPLSKAEGERHRPYFTKSAVAYQNNPQHRQLFPYTDYWRARYDAGVPQVNEYLAALRDRLDQMNLWDDTYIILTADHGESLGEHKLWAHGLSAHQDQLHVPLILRWPGHIPAGKRLPQTVRLFDIMPTLLEQLGINVEDQLQAQSLTGLIGNQSSASLPAFAEAVKKRPDEKALVVEQWKLLAYMDEDRYELYNLDTDPTEQNNLADQHPQRVLDLKRQLARQIEENNQLGAGVKARDAIMNKADLERLKALGYIGGDEEDEEDGDEQDPNATTTQPTTKPTPQSQPRP